MANLQETARGGLGGVRPWGALLAFLRWWGTELVALLPSKTRWLVPGTGHRLILDIDGNQVIVTECRGSAEKQLGTYALEPSQENGPNKGPASLLEGLNLAGAEVVVRLPQGQALCREMALPLEAEKNLRTVLGYEMDRQTPFRSDQVYYDYRILERQADNKRLLVRVVAMPRGLLDGMVQTVLKWGLRPTWVTVKDGNGDAPGRCGISSVNLLPVERGTIHGPVWGRLNRLLALLAMALVIAALLIPFYQQGRKMRALEQRVATFRAEAEALQPLAAKLERLRNESRFLAAQGQKGPMAIDVVNELSRLLPDDTWLDGIALKGGKIQIRGVSADASALVGLLEASPMFQNTAFRSPTTRDPGSGRDRFEIAAEISPGSRP